MSTFSAGKTSHNKNDVKNASLVMKSRQQVINEVNKRRTLLQDNSWIKKRPEEENPNENYGRVVLNQYKSQDSLHRNPGEKDDEKTLLNRYRSDTTLDRIPGRSEADKGKNQSVLESTQNKSKEQNVSGNAGNSSSPVKKKRQSWMPPSDSSEKVKIDDMEQNKRHSWTPSNSAARVTINNKLSQEVKGAGDKSDQRSLDDLIKVNQTPKLQGNNCNLDSLITVKDKSADGDLDKLIAIKNKSVDGHQDLDDLIKVNRTSNRHGQGHQDLDDLIKVNRTPNRHGQGHQDLDDHIKVNRTSNQHGQGCDLDSLIAVKDKSEERPQDLNDLITVNRRLEQHEIGLQDLTNIFRVNPTLAQHRKEQHKMEDLIKVNYTSNRADKDRELDRFIKVKHQANQDLDVLTKGNLESNQYGKRQLFHVAYEDSVPRRSIKTIYSTSDKSIIEKELCTYCRKPLGTDTKMVLEALQICCHATCFKCEVCKAPLENLKAGDSIWIFKNTVHCAPCYSKVKAMWIY